MPSKKRRRSSSFRRERHNYTYNCKMSFQSDSEPRHLPQIYPDWDEQLNETIRQELLMIGTNNNHNKDKPTTPPSVSPVKISDDNSQQRQQQQQESADQQIGALDISDPTADSRHEIRFAVLPNGKFDNEFQDKLREQVQMLLTHHVKSEQIDCTDRSMYTGLPGISLLYHHLSTMTSLSSKMREELASKATHHVNQYMTSIQSQHMHNSKCPSYLCGDLGVYTLSAIVRNQQRLHREALVRTLSDPGSATIMPPSAVPPFALAPASTAPTAPLTTTTAPSVSPTLEATTTGAATAASHLTSVTTAPQSMTHPSASETSLSPSASSSSQADATRCTNSTGSIPTTGAPIDQASNFFVEQISGGTEPETSLLLDKIMELIKMQELPGTPDELLYGRTGGLYAMMLIKQQLPKQTIVKDEHIVNHIAITLKSGQTMESFGRPLFYAWHGKEYVGTAHGYAGILYMLLEASNYLNEDQLRLVRDAVDFVENIKYPSNNYPSSIGSQTDRLVHWCHGAPGVVHMLAKAYQVYHDQRYLASALACGELIWQRGLLKKGFGLCHGIAGNGYAFIRLYQLTKDLKHLYRAGKFAQYYMEHRETINWRADSQASLFEGYAGLAFYLADLLNPDGARFPAFQLTA